LTHAELIKTAYATLGLEFGATEAQVKAAYRTLSKKYHPDLSENKVDQKELEHLGHLQAELNGARNTLQEYFDLQKAKEQVSQKEQDKAIRLMYTSALKTEIDKTKLVMSKAETSIKRIIADFGERRINNATPLFNDVKKLVAEQKEILNKCSAFATPLLVRMQAKNIEELEKHINSYDYFSEVASIIMPKIIKEVNDVVKAPPHDNPTLNTLYNALTNELRIIHDSVQKNGGPANLNSKEVGRFLDVYSSFFKGKIREMIPGVIGSDLFYQDSYTHLRLITTTNETLPFTRNFSSSSNIQLVNAGVDYLLDNININVLDSLVDNPSPNFSYLQDLYEEQFREILNNLRIDYVNWQELQRLINEKFLQHLHDSSLFFRLAKSYNQYYFLKDFKLEKHKTTLEILESIKNHTEETLKQYTTSIFDTPADEKSAIEDPSKFAESIHKFISDFAFSDNITKNKYRRIGIHLNSHAQNVPALAFMKNNFKNLYPAEFLRSDGYVNAYDIYYDISKWCCRHIKWITGMFGNADASTFHKELREIIASIGDFANKVENFENKNNAATYEKSSLRNLRNCLEVFEEIEKMMNLPYYNEVCKKIYEGFYFEDSPCYITLTQKVTRNIDKFYKDLLVKILFDKNKTLTESEAHFLEFSKEYLAKVNKHLPDIYFKEAYKSAIYIQEMLQGLKNSGVDINDSKALEKFIVDRFDQAIYKTPEAIIGRANANYDRTAAEKIALMMLEPSIKYDIKHRPDVYDALSLQIIWKIKIPREELVPILDKYKDKLDEKIIERMNVSTGLDIKPTPAPPAPPPISMAR
jgi:hypothetical protein